jgi:hypothetical protein
MVALLVVVVVVLQVWAMPPEGDPPPPAAAGAPPERAVTAWLRSLIGTGGFRMMMVCPASQEVTQGSDRTSRFNSHHRVSVPSWSSRGSLVSAWGVWCAVLCCGGVSHEAYAADGMMGCDAT